MQGTQNRVMLGMVEETPGISHYFERVRKICPTLCRQSIRDCCEPQRFRLFLSKPCSLLIQMTVYPMPCTQAGLITGCFLPRAHLLTMVSQRSTPTLSSSSRFHSSFRSIGCGLNTWPKMFNGQYSKQGAPETRKREHHFNQDPAPRFPCISQQDSRVAAVGPFCKPCRQMPCCTLEPTDPWSLCLESKLVCQAFVKVANGERVVGGRDGERIEVYFF